MADGDRDSVVGGIEMKWTTDEIVGVFLGMALLCSVFMSMENLAMSIASGLIGYMGRALVKGGEDK